MTATELRDQMLVEWYADTSAAARLAAVNATPWTLAEQSAHRQALAADGLIPKWNCVPCLRGEHGPCPDKGTEDAA